MILNGKCKVDFEKWINENYKDLLYSMMGSQTLLKDVLLAEHIKNTDKLLNNVIIEFFDSVGIYIDIGGIDYRGLEYWYNIQQPNTLNGENGEYFDTRQQATEKAIEKANEIYNK